MRHHCHSSLLPLTQPVEKIVPAGRHALFALPFPRLKEDVVLALNLFYFFEKKGREGWRGGGKEGGCKFREGLVSSRGIMKKIKNKIK